MKLFYQFWRIDMIRMHEQIGPHRICWMQDVSEHVEEVTRGWIRRYTRMLPTERTILFAWSDEEGLGAVSMHRIESDDGYCFAFFLHDDWWTATPEQREYDFVMSFIVGGLTESGALTMSEGDLCLHLKNRRLRADAATAHLNGMADRILTDWRGDY